MTGPLYRLGHLVTRHPRIVVGAWLVFTVAIVLLANAAGRPTSDDTTIPGSDSTRATNLLERELPSQANGSIPIVVEAPSGSVTSSSNQAAIEATVKSLNEDEYVRQAVDPFSDQGAGAISQDGTTAIVSTYLTLGPGDIDDDQANEIFDSTAPASDAGLEVSAGGYLGTQLSQPSTRLSEIVGIVAAMIVLVLVIGTVAAMAMPIGTALVGVISGLAVVGVVGTVLVVPSIAPTLAIMLGLGVGVDYSLFIVTRYRRLLEDGHPVPEAVARAVATSGGAVLFAGGTVILALLCLYFGGIPQVRQLGYSAAIAVAVVIVAALTLLPAGLALLGRRIDALRVRDASAEDPADGEAPSGWTRWARAVGRHPVPAAGVGILLLIVLAIPVTQISLGAQDNGQMPRSSTIRESYDALRSGFGVGFNGPLLVAVDLRPPAQEGGSAGAADPRLMTLEGDISNAADVAAVSPATVNQDGSAAAFSVVPGSAPSAERTRNLVNRLRDDVIPNALEGTNTRAYVGGTTAANIDLATKIGDKLPLVIAIIVGLSFVLLTLAFRTLVVPALAAVCNLLAIAASYGILVAIFQEGWGSGLIGLDHAIPIVSFVPLMMFAILFGLSTDYTVFLLTRVSEEFSLRGDHRQAIVEGLGRALRVIVAAAVIMILVFASFILNGNPTVKQFGVGLAVAVAVDAVIVCLVMPALMLLIGRATWWMPGILDRRLPRLGIEGEEYFQRRDRVEGAIPEQEAVARS